MQALVRHRAPVERGHSAASSTSVTLEAVPSNIKAVRTCTSRTSSAVERRLVWLLLDFFTSTAVPSCESIERVTLMLEARISALSTLLRSKVTVEGDDFAKFGELREFSTRSSEDVPRLEPSVLV